MNSKHKIIEVIDVDEEQDFKKNKVENICNGCMKSIINSSLCDNCKKDKLCPNKEKCNKNITCSCNRKGCNDCINICFVCCDNTCLECQGDFCCICKSTSCLKPNCMAQIFNCDGIEHDGFRGYCVDCAKEEECLNCHNWFCEKCLGEEDCPSCEDDEEDEENDEE